MCPRLGSNIPLRLPLDTIITNRRSCVQTLFNILIGQLCDVSRLHGVMHPDTSQAVCLKLDPHRFAGRAAG